MPEAKNPPLSKITNAWRTQTTAFHEEAIETSKGAHLDPHRRAIMTRKINPDMWDETRPLSVVVDTLPKFKGKTLTELIEERIGEKPDEKIRVWDLGSGDRAVALSELVTQYPAIEGIGVTLPVRRTKRNHPNNVTVIRQDIDEYLKKFLGLERQREEAGQETTRPDFIYMSKLLRWVPHPLSTIKKAYNALATDGILLIDEVLNSQSPLLDSTGKPADPSQLESALQQEGYDVEIVSTKHSVNGVRGTYTFAIRKTADHPRLNLPITPITPDQAGIDLERHNSPLIYVPERVKYLYKLTTKTKAPQTT